MTQPVTVHAKSLTTVYPATFSNQLTDIIHYISFSFTLSICISTIGRFNYFRFVQYQRELTLPASFIYYYHYHY